MLTIFPWESNKPFCPNLHRGIREKRFYKRSMIKKLPWKDKYIAIAHSSTHFIQVFKEIALKINFSKTETIAWNQNEYSKGTYNIVCYLHFKWYVCVPVSRNLRSAPHGRGRFDGKTHSPVSPCFPSVEHASPRRQRFCLSSTSSSHRFKSRL